MKEYTEIKIVNSKYSNSEILNAEGLISLKSEEESVPSIVCKPVREQNGNLIFRTDYYSFGVSESVANKGTKVEIFVDMKKEQKVADGVVQSKFFEKAVSEDIEIKQRLNSDNSHKVEFPMEFSQKEKEFLEYGITPVDMGDKWFCYMENDVLYCFGIWTKKEIFQVRLTQTEDGKWVMNEFIAAITGEVPFFAQRSSFKFLINSQIKRMKKIMR